jgi:hypothetical protein
VQITIHDTNELSALDLRVLHALVGGEAPSTPVSQPTTAKAAPAKAPEKAEKAAPAKEEPVAEAEPEEAEVDEAPAADAPTKKDAVALATKLVSEGQAANVKKVLTDLGAKRVSELADEDVPAFIAALS